MVLVSPSFVTECVLLLRRRTLPLLTTRTPSSPPIVPETLSGEWRAACAANKGGKGDGSGRLSDEAMAVVGACTHEPLWTMERY